MQLVQSRGCMPISELRGIMAQMRGTQATQGMRIWLPRVAASEQVAEIAISRLFCWFLTTQRT